MEPYFWFIGGPWDGHKLTAGYQICVNAVGVRGYYAPLVDEWGKLSDLALWRGWGDDPNRWEDS